MSIFNRCQAAYDHAMPDEFEPSPCPTCGEDSYKLTWDDKIDDCDDCYDAKREDAQGQDDGEY